MISILELTIQTLPPLQRKYQAKFGQQKKTYAVLWCKILRNTTFCHINITRYTHKHNKLYN